MQFGFHQNYSTFFALIHLIETIKEAHDWGKYDCYFIELQKTFDTVDHNILLVKLKLAELYLKDRKQYVSVNGCNSKHLPVSLGVPQSSVLGTLLFLVYINDPNTAIKQCKVHHFSDDKNLLYINESVKN